MRYILIFTNCPCRARIPLNPLFFPAMLQSLLGLLATSAMLHNSLIIIVFFFLIKCPSSCPKAQNTHTHRHHPKQLQSSALCSSNKVFLQRPHTTFHLSILQNTRSLLQIKNHQEKKHPWKNGTDLEKHPPPLKFQYPADVDNIFFPLPFFFNIYNFE